MKKRILIGVSVIAGLALSSFMTLSSVSIKLHNPCSKHMTFAHSNSPTGASMTQGVSAGKTVSWNVEEGRYINYKLPGKSFQSLGKVEYKGQVFSCRCK